jgi:hypothetical protein
VGLEKKKINRECAEKYLCPTCLKVIERNTETSTLLLPDKFTDVFESSLRKIFDGNKGLLI